MSLRPWFIVQFLPSFQWTLLLHLQGGSITNSNRHLFLRDLMSSQTWTSFHWGGFRVRGLALTSGLSKYTEEIGGCLMMYVIIIFFGTRTSDITYNLGGLGRCWAQPWARHIKSLAYGDVFVLDEGCDWILKYSHQIKILKWDIFWQHYLREI